jgi:hypothetical protein
MTPLTTFEDRIKAIQPRLARLRDQLGSTAAT